MAAAVASRAFPTPPDLVDPSGDVAVWYTQPDGAVSQLQHPARINVAHVEWLLGPAEAALRARFPGAKSLVWVLDLTNMTERDPAARAMMLRRAPMYATGMTTYIVPPAGTNRILLMSVTAGAMLMRSFGIEVVIRSSFLALRDELRLRHDARAPTRR